MSTRTKGESASIDSFCAHQSISGACSGTIVLLRLSILVVSKYQYRR